MADEEKPDYPVGFGKPPRHTRFRPGQSGNPKGRPKGAKNLATLMDKVLKEPVVISENGRRRMITKREAMLKQLVNRAAGGDPAGDPVAARRDPPARGAAIRRGPS